MNKTFNINLGGYPFAIDEDAYEYIQNYLGTIRRHFSASDGCLGAPQRRDDALDPRGDWHRLGKDGVLPLADP